MSKIKNIEKLDAHTLPHYLREIVIEECRRNAKSNALRWMIFLVFTVSFTYAGSMAIRITGSEPEKKYGILFALPFLAVPFFLLYMLFIKPRKMLKMAENDDYEYYIGALTDKKVSYGDDSDDHYLYIDNVLKCSCTRDQYRAARLGDRYAAVFFHKKRPELCVKLPDKDTVYVQDYTSQKDII